MFRHTRATHLAKHLTEQELKVFFGWTMGSNMPSTYVHLSGQDIEDKILALNGIKKIEKEEIPKIPTKKCPKCGETNSIGNKFCIKCETPLDLKVVEEIEAIKKILGEVTLFILEKMKERRIDERDLKEIVREWYTKQNC
ncbi:MAG: zinc ribbon domain-containing protein [Candidatus Aenigmarchaeota archaeon]|nr:zinc ribbon domain-containing protein [Candidatus Aenigmarchaeota archaeon]